MSNANLGSELLKQASLTGSGSSAPALPQQDRAELWRRIERSRARARRLTRWALYALALLAGSIVMIIIAKNGQNQDQGIRLFLRYAGSTGAFLGMYGGVLLVATILFNVLSARALELSGRLANMENLLEGMVVQLDQMSQRLDAAKR